MKATYDETTQGLPTIQETIYSVDYPASHTRTYDYRYAYLSSRVGPMVLMYAMGQDALFVRFGGWPVNESGELGEPVGPVDTLSKVVDLVEQSLQSRQQ